MKRSVLSALAVVLAVGCTPAPGPGPVGNTSSPDLSVSIPDSGELTMVSLNIPGMT